MLKDINNHVRFCSTRQKLQTSHSSTCRHFSNTCLPTSLQNSCNQWILSWLPGMSNSFSFKKQLSQHVLHYWLKSISRATVFHAKLISDNKTQFVSQIMQYTAERFFIKQSLIAVCHPELNLTNTATSKPFLPLPYNKTTIHGI